MTIRDAKLDFAYNPGDRDSTDFIILHHAAGDGSAEDVHNYHKKVKGWSGIAYHFYVDKLGGVTKGREIEWNGGHTTGYNQSSVGICFEGNFEADEMSAQQLKAGAALLQMLREKYPAAKITTHGALNATACPGRKFPLEEMIAGSEKEVPSEWAQETVNEWIRLGILKGDSEGHYGLHEPVTLERMIVLVDRAIRSL
jgi:N-acetyl-anhydromuramyl-L-alanine amidase AmpD